MADLKMDRPSNQLRPVVIQRGFTEQTPGSVLISMGKTMVLCTVSVDTDVPPWMRGSDEGWVTAEYSMLPGSGNSRINRKSISGGRTKEIQRLIGRSLRAAVDLKKMPELTVRIDCDVLQADGGTRTASITGAWVALADAFDVLAQDGRLKADPMLGHVAAISVGLIEGEAVLDLEYTQDVAADVDMNVVMTGSGELIEVQGTAEGQTFSRRQLDAMLDLAGRGIEELVGFQAAARTA